jgi:hypothetical protein
MFELTIGEYPGMRCADQLRQGGSVFYTFNGSDWIESGRTSYPPTKWEDVKYATGNTLMVYEHGNKRMNDRITLRDGDRILSSVPGYIHDFQYCSHFYADGDICMLSTSHVFRHPIVSCGKSTKYVEADKSLSYEHVKNYREGIVYMASNRDTRIDTDIPIQLVKIGDMLHMYDVGMHDHCLYAVETVKDRDLWCRDIRIPASFRTGRSYSGIYFDRPPICTKSGIIMYITVDSPHAFGIVDMRYPSVEYEVGGLNSNGYVNLLRD